MKYEAEIDLRNANTSHALLVELTGPDRRVLDVGCAGGDLGRVLKARGCRVAGVEIDEAAAEAAAEVVDEVLIGDVDELDLVGHFGKESFDVVVFGDVLEHVADPVATLRKVRPLLTETGSIVASIPNVAHGAVRLALLKGRFEYRPLGLLDATHLRFFTRGSVYETFREAGLVPVDVRRTTAGVFDTEIDVSRDEFDEGVVDAVEGDPESTTYQFVLRAVAEDSSEAIAGSPRAPERGHEAGTRVGVCADWPADDLRTALAVRVAVAELGRRLPGATVRVFNARPDAGPSTHDGGLAVEPLGADRPESADRPAGQLDCLVVTGEVGDGAVRRPAAGTDGSCAVVSSAVRPRRAAVDPDGEGAAGPVYEAVVSDDGDVAPPGADGDLGVVPDPVALVPRLLRPEALARRVDFVGMMGWRPTSGPVVAVEAGPDLAANVRALARSLDAAIDAGAGAVLVNLHPGSETAAAECDDLEAAMARPVHRVPDDALVDDIVAVIASATAFVVSTPWGSALAEAYGVPTVGHARGDCLEDALGQHVAGGASAAVAARQAALDAHFDRVAAIAQAEAAGRPCPGEALPALSPAEYVAAVELAHRRMRERLLAERLAVADHLARSDDDLLVLRSEVERLEAERRALEVRLERATAEHDACRSEVACVRAELEALKNIRVLRALRPARATYARLRGGRL